jgi:SH3-like domain-containing protein
MVMEKINTALQEIARPYADRRVNIFEIEALEVQGTDLPLRGRVLDESSLRALVQGLAERFPDLRPDTGEITVARRTSPVMRSVATNLTSVHDGTSFLAEQVTQMLNGATVEVLWEQGRWGFVRQADGYLGWTYLPYLTDAPAPQPTHLVTSPVGLLRETPRTDAPLVTRVLGGTAVCAGEQREDWSVVELCGGMRGWLPQPHLRELDDLPVDRAARRASLSRDALHMIGVPYLWGGCSANGIDCSGFAQLLHRWVGITIPRDADMQFSAGQPVDAPFETGDLLFFGEKGEQRRITHVGISLGGWRIIHSSRSRNGVQVDDVQSVPHLRDDFLCAATYIGR